MKRHALMLIILSLLSGCTSTIALGTAYNAIGKSVVKRMTDYADFNQRQKKEITLRVTAFHQWHRQQQLPAYQQLLIQIAESIETPDTLKKDSVNQWVQTSRQFSKQLAQCNPLNNSDKLLSELTDQQVQQIALKIRDKQIQRVREYQSETNTQRLNRKHRELLKWAKQIGLDLSTEQSRQLKLTLSNQPSLTPQRHQLWQMWSDHFIDKLRRRSQPGFASDMNKHIASLWDLTERTYPDQWTTNIDLWSDYIYRFLKSQTPEQSRKLRKKLTSLSQSLKSLSAKETRQQPQCFSLASVAD